VQYFVTPIRNAALNAVTSLGSNIEYVALMETMRLNEPRLEFRRAKLALVSKVMSSNYAVSELVAMYI